MLIPFSPSISQCFTIWNFRDASTKDGCKFPNTGTSDSSADTSASIRSFPHFLSPFGCCRLISIASLNFLKLMSSLPRPFNKDFSLYRVLPFDLVPPWVPPLMVKSLGDLSTSQLITSIPWHACPDVFDSAWQVSLQQTLDIDPPLVLHTGVSVCAHIIILHLGVSGVSLDFAWTF